MLSGSPDVSTDTMGTVLWYVLTGTHGGENRVYTFKTVEEQPRNANQLAGMLDLDYKIVRHHLSVLMDNDVAQ